MIFSRTARKLTFIAAVAIIPAGTAHGASDLDTCLDGEYTENLKPIIEACISAVDSGKLTGKARTDALYKRADGFYRAGQLELALNDLNAILEAEPDNGPALVRRARLYFRANSIRAAFMDAQAAIALTPPPQGAYGVMGRLMKASGMDLDRTAAAFEQELEAYPDNWFAHQDLANVYMRQGKVEQALKEINTVLDAGHDILDKIFLWYPTATSKFGVYAYAKWTRADMYYRTHQYTAAMADYDELVRDWPNEANFLTDRARVHSVLKNPGKALDDLDRAIGIAPNRADARVERVEVLLKLRRIDDALVEIDKVLAGWTTNYQRGVVLDQRSQIYRQRGMREESLRDTEASLAAYPPFLPNVLSRLAAAGYYEGSADDAHSEKLRNGLKACIIDPKC